MHSIQPTPQNALENVLYVSRACVAKIDVAAIVAHARSANAAKGLTGGLLYTGNYFAQALLEWISGGM